MSKGDGQKITIKFTEPLNPVNQNPPKYKFFRWEIKSGWSTRIYLYNIMLKTDGNYFTPPGTISCSSQRAGYEATKAFDGNATGTYWYPNVVINEWIQIELAEAVTPSGFQWTTSTSAYRPRLFNLLGSHDSITWDLLLEAESPNLNYYKPLGVVLELPDVKALTISGQEYQYIGGPIITKNYKVVDVENHPTLSNEHLLIITHSQGRFNNVVSPLTVTYNSTIGTLLGRGGKVESFERIFTPTDLIPVPNPHVTEHLTASANANIDFLEVSYSNAYSDEAIVVSATATVAFIHVNDLNP